MPAGVTAFYYGDARRGVRYARVQPWLLYLDPPAKGPSSPVACGPCGRRSLRHSGHRHGDRDHRGDRRHRRSGGHLRVERDRRDHPAGRHDQAAGRGLPLSGVCPGGRLRRRGRRRRSLRALPVPRPRAARHLRPGSGGGSRPQGPGDLRALRTGELGCRLCGLAGEAPRRQGQDRRHRLWDPGRRAPDQAARPRRPQRPVLFTQPPAPVSGDQPLRRSCQCRPHGSAS